MKKTILPFRNAGAKKKLTNRFFHSFIFQLAMSNARFPIRFLNPDQIDATTEKGVKLIDPQSELYFYLLGMRHGLQKFVGDKIQHLMPVDFHIRVADPSSSHSNETILQRIKYLEGKEIDMKVVFRGNELVVRAPSLDGCEWTYITVGAFVPNPNFGPDELSEILASTSI